MIRNPLRKRRTTPRPGRLKGEAMRELRMACFVRDVFRCQECGRSVFSTLTNTHERSAHMAHIQAKRRGGDSLENVRTLCGRCHRLEHQYGKSMQKPCPKKEAINVE